MTTRRHLLRGAVGTAALATVGAAGTGTGTGTAQAAQAAPLTPTVGTAGTASTALDIGILLYDGYS
ncbi:hypothetical protein HCK01_27385, partial [Streptomyces sp. AA8]|nr:hypothetical protein [Streptomyces telluris]